MICEFVGACQILPFIEVAIGRMKFSSLHFWSHGWSKPESTKSCVEMDCMRSGSVPAAMSCLAYAVRSEPGVTNFLTVRPGTPESFMPCAMTPSQNEAVSAGVSNTIQLISTGAAVVGSVFDWGASVD